MLSNLIFFCLFCFAITIILYSWITYNKSKHENEQKLLKKFLEETEIQSFLIEIQILSQDEIQKFFSEIQDLNKDEFQDFHQKIKKLNAIQSYEEESISHQKINNIDSVTSYYQLGKDYYNKNNEKSFYFYKKASQHSIDAKYELALMYYYGIGTDVNFSESFKIFDEIKDKKNISYYLAIMYYKGLGIHKNKEKSAIYANLCHTSNDPLISEILKRSTTINPSDHYESKIKSRNINSSHNNKSSNSFNNYTLAKQDEFLDIWNEIEHLLKNSNTSNSSVVLNINNLSNKNMISKDLANQLNIVRKRRNDFIHNKKKSDKINEDDVNLAKSALNKLRVNNRA